MSSRLNGTLVNQFTNLKGHHVSETNYKFHQAQVCGRFPHYIAYSLGTLVVGYIAV